jgi:hypothetical protein
MPLGAYFGRAAAFTSADPFVGYVAPADTIAVGILAERLRAFYAELFTSLAVTIALAAMATATPDFGYVFSTAYGLFWSVFAMLMRGRCGRGTSLTRGCDGAARPNRDRAGN